MLESLGETNAAAERSFAFSVERSRSVGSRVIRFPSECLKFGQQRSPLQAKQICGLALVATSALQGLREERQFDASDDRIEVQAINRNLHHRRPTGCGMARRSRKIFQIQ